MSRGKNTQVKYRKSYIFVRKSITDMEKLHIQGDIRKPLIDDDDNVLILKSYNKLEPIEF